MTGIAPDTVVTAPSADGLGLRVSAQGSRLPTEPLETIGPSDSVFPVRAPDGGPITVVLPLHHDETIVGFGEQFVELSQRARRIDGRIESALHVPPRGSYFVAPYFHSSRGYSLHVDTLAPWAADVGLTNSNQLEITVWAARLDIHVHVGTPRSALAALRRRYGPPATPPEWAFGTWVAARSGTSAVLAELDRYRRADIPVAAVWIDDYYDPASNSGDGISYPYPPGDYPDIPCLIAAVHDRGIRALGYINCALYRDTPAYEEAIATGAAVQTIDGETFHMRFFHPQRQHGDRDGAWGIVMHDDVAAIVDFEKPQGLGLWRRLVSRMLDDGWDGWMQDFGEQHPDSAKHNAYPLEYHRATADVLRQRGADALFFVRSAAIGTQADAPIMWGGDQGNDWTRERGLASLLPAGISAGLSGVAVWCPDIAGLVELDSDYDHGGQDEELWIRWLQFGALSPVMRLHLGFKNRDGLGVGVWTSPLTTALFRSYARLHQQLRPYLMNQARHAAETGLPVLRSLALEFADDAESWRIGDEYLLGDAILVAPVIERGDRARIVYLPEGLWTDFWTGEELIGGGWVTIPAPIERIPILLRGDHASPLSPSLGVSLAQELAALSDHT